MSKIGVIVLATGQYFPLGLRLIHRFSHFYIGTSSIHFHFFSDCNPQKYVSLKNLFYHRSEPTDWNSTMLFKLEAASEIVNSESYDYFVYIDADSNIYKNFKDEDFVSDSFILKHHSSELKDIHYEKNKLSSAYIDPKKYPEHYYHACYFGGNRTNLSKILKASISLFKQDVKNNIMARAEDESYLNKVFSIKAPETIFDTANREFPISTGDKGGYPKHTWGKTILFEDELPTLFTLKEYNDILNNIKKIKNKNVLWNISSSKVTYP
jgi:hypothetical protein